MQPEKFGASVFGLDDVYNKFKVFHAQVPITHFRFHTPIKTPIDMHTYTLPPLQAAKPLGSGTPRQLFVVSVDVKTCFDTIHVHTLMNTLKVNVFRRAYMCLRLCLRLCAYKVMCMFSHVSTLKMCVH